MDFSSEQMKRLTELGSDPEDIPGGFSDKAEANRAFQSLEKAAARLCAEGVLRHMRDVRRPEVSVLSETLSKALADFGFTEVATPLTVSRRFLERMGIGQDHPLMEQIFWVGKNRAMRPMLAPNLYYVMVDLLRIAPRPVSIFEIGTCMRRETRGASHSEEFTMLNLAEFGLPLEGRQERIRRLAELVLDAASLGGGMCSFAAEESGVYGETLDIVSPDGLELASTAMGPHPMDGAWGVTVPWVGLGFGIERLVMARAAARGERFGLSRAARSLSYLGGWRLNVPGKEERT
ncbi:MAG: pyrrolysine--tRNA(Pyl) ligase large subunit [Deltaproteobacteria bacterium]|jgi:phenylalanyl-tRNA synthetase alpha chain|nr:pyrrolysine--tRNA(Pyl) ligase large subunit [Deltaproteobacteria bacterium]